MLEYIIQVAALLQNWLIEFTKVPFQADHDNALVEVKMVLCQKTVGYAHIAQRWAPLINEFNHSTCFLISTTIAPAFSKTITDSKVRTRKSILWRYDDTYDKLKSIENAKNYLKLDITFEILDKVALNQTDDQLLNNYQKSALNYLKPLMNET